MMQNNNGKYGKSEATGNEPQTERQYQAWRYENPDNETTREVRGSTMRWCTNDCHSKPMWCGRKNCLNRADFAKAMKEKRERAKAEKGNENNEDSKKPKFNKDFKIALQTMTSNEYFKTLQEQFLQGN